jgi:hypothetical protein
VEKTAITRPFLRTAAQAVLEKKLGYRVEIDAQRQGVAPGARLLATQGDRTFSVAVRTSLSRRVRLMPRDDGYWRTVSDVDLVVVAVPAYRNSSAIEVLGFEASAMIERFNAALKTLPSSSAADLPVVIAIDEKTRRGSRNVPADLKSAALWHYVLPLSAPLLLDIANSQSRKGFVERVKREFAQLNGVDVSKVAVEFKIIS